MARGIRNADFFGSEKRQNLHGVPNFNYRVKKKKKKTEWTFSYGVHAYDEL